MLAHNLSGINLITRINKELATILQFIDAIGESRSCLHSNHGTIHTTFNLAFIWLVLFETVRHDGLSLTGCEHVGAQADNATRRNIELNVHSVGLTLHRCHLTFSASHHIYHFRRECLRNVDGQLFNRFATFSVDFLIDYLRLPHLQFIALATHSFDENRQMQHTTTAYNPLVSRVFERFYAQGEILLQFFLQAVIDVSRGAELAFLAKER